ncbi:uncharacterized protein Eint_041210 [Encephalitozoon intestinalis ATCC 50506]|uniref:Hpc2-related domain-containing protein n=1 Tax=Encephalitozoon intestinalis (strain ATCC 50506) TaxID=876142 RepID=E0S6S5_ENCIT|nr:uncharacterized protein Eint_041210 [Encephalitozoon intestinalis ATCC 50506]ADM11410.1 hypothetical protein Eint_041210 [Encephalitozoon intestinalis ATCC 50506]UTX45102.1 hypothetical protein GPK93_04g06400 [Encephalitozoon intestinalis]
MNFEKEITVQVSVMESKEIDLLKKEKPRKRRQRADEYDYNDPFIEPFEGETQMVMIECKLEDFFVYKGRLPYSAKKVLSVHKARERSKLLKSGTGSLDKGNDVKKERSKGKLSNTKTLASKRKYGKIPKNDTKICDCLASLIKSGIEKLERPIQPGDCKTEYYVSLMVLEIFQKERELDWGLPGLDSAEKPSDEEANKYVKDCENKMEGVFSAIAEDIRSYHLYSEDLSLFKGFQKEGFLFNVSEYFLLFIKTSLMNQKSISFNKARKEAYNNILDLFPNTCKNSTQTKYYLTKYILQTHGGKDLIGDSDREHGEKDEKCITPSDLERVE